MKRSMQKITMTLMAVLAGATVGCGQGFRSSSDGGATALRVSQVNMAVKQAEEASTGAQSAIVEAQQILREIQDDQGNIKIGLFTKSKTTEVQSQFLLNGVITKLRAVFDRVFEKVALVKSKFGDARRLLADAAGKLDAANPTQAAMLAQIKAELGKIDALEAQFDTSMHMLASKLDLATSALDKIITGVTSFIPGWGSLVGLAIDFFVMSDVKTLISELKLKLLAV